MKVAYVTTYDAHDPLMWSGLGLRIAQSLEEQGIDVLYVGPLRQVWEPLFKVKHAWHKLVLRKSYTREREPVIARGFAKQVLEQIRGQNVDAVFSPGTIPISLLDCPQPIVTWSDATLASMLGYYPVVNNLSAGSVRMGLDLERKAISRIAMSIFTSTWAADSAIRAYDADPAKVCVIPFGAIIPDPPARSAVDAAIAARPTDRCQILFIAVDWARKGGDVALAAAAEMNRAGVPTELVVLGSSPPGPLPPYVKAMGFVNKSTPEGRATLDHLLATSHFLMLPSTAEAFGLAPCEANAHGVPALTSLTGGLAEIVRDGVNGYAFPVGTPGDAYAQKMLALLRAPDEYRALCHGARGEYETRLNWDVAGRRVKEILQRLVDQARSKP